MPMKVSVVTGSVSRNAGGTFDAIRRPVNVMAARRNIDFQILGTNDCFTPEDLPRWEPLVPETFKVYGPRSYGYTPGFYQGLSRFRPDLQHVHGIWMHYSLANYRYHRRSGTPYVVSPHGMLDTWAVRHSSWKKRLVATLFERRHLQKAGCIHALCEAEAEAIRAFGMKNPICCIPNGVDIPSEMPGGSPPWEGTVEEGKRVLLFLGRIHPKKGLPALLEAWRLVQQGRAQASDWVLAIAGWDQGGHEATLRSYVTDHSLDKSVCFLGPLFGDAKGAALASASAFILPSLSEGLPMTVLEAWAYDLPVLMTPACNLAAGYAAGAALRITPDSEGIANGLRSLFSLAEPERGEIGRRGHNLVMERFTWERVAGQFHDIYSWLVGGGSTPDCIT